MTDLPRFSRKYNPIKAFAGEPIFDFIGYRQARARWLSDPTPANSHALNSALDFERSIPSDHRRAMPRGGRR